MPLYANVDGARKELVGMYANIDGASRQINAMYANIDGAQKQIYSSGARYYRISPSDGEEEWIERPDMTNTRVIAPDFTIRPVLGRFSLASPRWDGNLPPGWYFYSVEDVSLGLMSFVKQSKGYYVGGYDVEFRKWEIEFGTDSPNALDMAYVPDTRDYFVGDDHNLYIRMGFATYYRWRQAPDSGSYWYSTKDATPTGYDENTKTIIN